MAANRITAKYAVANRERELKAAALHNSRACVSSLHRDVRAIMQTPGQKDHYGRSPLHLAAEIGHMVSGACACIFFVCVTTSDHFLLLQDSLNFCLNSSNREMRNVESRDFMALTPLHAAARTDMWSAVIALLDAGADVNAVGGPTGVRPLHEAAANDSYQSALILMSRGADRRFASFLS